MNKPPPETNGDKPLNMADINKQGRHCREISFLLDLVDQSGQPFCVTLYCGNIHYCNPAFCQLTGYTMDELQQTNWRELTPPQWQTLTLNTIEILRCTNQPQRYEKECRCKNGTLIPVESFLHHMCDGEGKVVCYYSFVTDITRRKQAVAVLHQIAVEFQAVFKLLSDVYFKLASDGTILDYRTESLSERCILPKKVIGQKIQDCFPDPVGQKFGQVLNQLHTTRSLVAIEFDLPFKNKVLFYEARFLPIPANQIIVIMRNITKRKTTEQKLRHISFHDPLTKLHNRAYFQHEMSRLESNNSLPTGIMVCDVDRLKTYNDSFGHKVGDTLLVRTASVLNKSFRKGDTIARIGGDEFAVLLPKVNHDVMEKICQRIRTAIEEDNRQNPDLPLSISVGYALSREKEVNVEDLFKEADNNMYRNKLLHDHRS